MWMIIAQTPCKHAWRCWAGLLLLLAATEWTRAQTNVGVAGAESPPPGESAPVTSTSEANPLTAARTLLRDGKLDDAMALAESALAAAPDNPDWLRIAGSVARQRGDDRSALSIYERLLVVTPGDPSAKAVLTLILQAVANASPQPEALPLLERAYELSEHAPALAMACCENARLETNLQAFVIAYERLDAKARARPDLRRTAADSYVTLKRPAAAAPLYELLLTATPKDIQLGEALVQAVTAGNHADGPNLLDTAARRFPSNLAILRAQALASSGDSGNTLRSLRSLSVVLAADPQDAVAANQRLSLLTDLGGVSLALASMGQHGDLIKTNLQRKVNERAAAQQQEWRAIDATLPGGEPAGLLVLAYGVLADPAPSDSDAIDVRTLVRHLEYLREHGYHILSLRDVAAAARRHTALPARATALIFRGHLTDFDQLVLPILEQYGFPAVLAVTTTDLTTSARVADRVSQADFRALAAHPLVTLASHSHALTAYVQSNPQGRLAPAAGARLFSPVNGAYETVDAYRARIIEDIKQSQALLLKAAGRPVDILVWPEGGANAMTLADAAILDITMMFTDAQANIPPREGLYPFLAVDPKLTLADLAAAAQRGGSRTPTAPADSFGMSVELDSVVTDDPDQTRVRLEALVTRAFDAGVDTVYLAAWSDANHDGLAEGLFYPNRVLPVRADILNHAVSLFRYRGLKVHVVMPTLGILPPGVAPDPRMFVMEYRWGQVRGTPPPNKRLSPFHPKSRKMVQMIFEDLAASVDFDGVLFRNDAYLTDHEDVGPAAAEVGLEKLGLRERNPEMLSPAQTKAWTELRITTIESLLSDLTQSVINLHPGTRIGRSIFGHVPLGPWNAQNYARALAVQDYVWIDATPETYGAEDPAGWFSSLLDAVQRPPGGTDKSVLAMGLFDETRHDWVSAAIWRKRIAQCRQQGFRQFAYFPDGGPTENTPSVRAIQSAAAASRSK